MKDQEIKYECEVYNKDFILHLYVRGVSDPIHIRNPKILYLFSLIKRYNITPLTPQDGKFINWWLIERIYPERRNKK